MPRLERYAAATLLPSYLRGYRTAAATNYYVPYCRKRITLLLDMEYLTAIRCRLHLPGLHHRITALPTCPPAALPAGGFRFLTAVLHRIATGVRGCCCACLAEGTVTCLLWVVYLFSPAAPLWTLPASRRACLRVVTAATIPRWHHLLLHFAALYCKRFAVAARQIQTAPVDYAYAGFLRLRGAFLCTCRITTVRRSCAAFRAAARGRITPACCYFCRSPAPGYRRGSLDVLVSLCTFTTADFAAAPAITLPTGATHAQHTPALPSSAATVLDSATRSRTRTAPVLPNVRSATFCRTCYSLPGLRSLRLPARTAFAACACVVFST